MVVARVYCEGGTILPQYKGKFGFQISHSVLQPRHSSVPIFTNGSHHVLQREVQQFLPNADARGAAGCQVGRQGVQVCDFGIIPRLLLMIAFFYRMNSLLFSLRVSTARECMLQPPTNASVRCVRLLLTDGHSPAFRSRRPTPSQQPLHPRAQRRGSQPPFNGILRSLLRSMSTLCLRHWHRLPLCRLPRCLPRVDHHVPHPAKSILGL